MNNERVLYLVFIFVLYSFLGWCIASLYTTIKEHKFVNKGILNGPMIITCGFSAILLTITFYGETNLLLIYVGSAIYISFAQLLGGKLLEELGRTRWWDYSKKRFNLEGYICLEHSLLFGFLGLFLLKVLNPLSSKLFHAIRPNMLRFSLIVSIGIMILDLLLSIWALRKLKNGNLKQMEEKNWLAREVYLRIASAYPKVKEKKRVLDKDNFGIYKFLLILIISGTLGCLIEMVYCRFSLGEWMSRSSLLYGEISLVWGLCVALFSIFLHMNRNKSNLFLFIYAMIIGSAFEYLAASCIIFVYNVSFWDYSQLPFNIHGRICLLFAFYWGVMGLLYIKLIYPTLNNLIDKIPEKPGKIITVILTTLLMVDIFISVAAGMRYKERRELQNNPSNKIEEICDRYYTDEYMQNRFKTLKPEE